MHMAVAGKRRRKHLTTGEVQHAALSDRFHAFLEFVGFAQARLLMEFMLGRLEYAVSRAPSIVMRVAIKPSGEFSAIPAASLSDASRT
jgi:hypothetical protein